MSFYKNDNGELLQADVYVHASTHKLLAESHDEYQYPVDGWWWFETEGEARVSLGVTVASEGTQ